ncbi:MAG: lipopolysaccharide heptosyltransferase I [Coxiellaceae bacterium]|nr:MAG: lipopolysaccharide heptosyltransferase I [Coxiellaceae bacterium]
MKVLVIKMSSMGDIIHTLPALTDAAAVYPHIEFTWLVEEGFAEIPQWHPQVKQIIPIAWRRWRKELRQAWHAGELKQFYQRLRAERYDRVIDAQGLIKSALVTRLARGLRCGLNWQSAWEPLASLAYQRRVSVKPAQHAIVRMRQLFSLALDYTSPMTVPDYGIKIAQPVLDSVPLKQPYLIFIHGTAWATKQWPVGHWALLGNLATAAGYQVYLPWGNITEQQRAQAIAASNTAIQVLPKLALSDIAVLLQQAAGAVAIDTGLGHLAAALSVPTVSIYGATDPKEIGTVGEKQRHLQASFPCSPCNQTRCSYRGASTVEPACYAEVKPELVWQTLLSLLKN